MTLFPAVRPVTLAFNLMVDTPSAFSFVGVMVIPLLASVAIFTLFPGFIKPTLLPFACKIQPLALMASATFFALASQLSLTSLSTLTVPSVPPVVLIVAKFASKVNSFPLRLILIVSPLSPPSLALNVTISPPFTLVALSSVSLFALIFHAAAFLTASVFICTLKVVLRTPLSVSSFESIVIDLSGEVTLYFTILPTTAFNCATLTASESLLPGARLVSWRVVSPSLPKETAPALPRIVFFTLSSTSALSINLTGA